MLSKFCVWPDGQILADEYGSKLREHFSLSLLSGLRVRIQDFLKKRILFVLKMSSGIKEKPNMSDSIAVTSKNNPSRIQKLYSRQFKTCA